jgi:hypothetical protein
MNKSEISKNLFKNKYDILLDNLKPFMFNNGRIDMLNQVESSDKVMNNNSIKSQIQPQKQPQPQPQIKIPASFLPREKDKLFWCFFVMKNGFVEYEKLRLDIDTNECINMVVEKKLKIDYVNKLRENKTIIKKYKIASLTDIENYLVNESVIDIKTFLTLCILEELSVLYIKKKSYYDLNFISSDTKSSKQHVILFHTPFKYTYEFEKTQTDIEKYKTDLYKLDNIDKPIKAFSSYKLGDLTEICSKLSIEIMNSSTQKKKTKQELYESILQYF